MLIFRIVNIFDKCLAKVSECLVLQGIPTLLRPYYSLKLDIVLDIWHITCYDIDREVEAH